MKRNIVWNFLDNYLLRGVISGLKFAGFGSFPIHLSLINSRILWNGGVS